MNKFDWAKRIERFSLEFYLSLLVVCLLAVLQLLIETLENGISTYVISGSLFMVAGITISWMSVAFLIKKREVKIKTVLFSRHFGTEFILFILLGLILLVNIEMSNASVRLGSGQYDYATLVPYLSFTVFLFKRWWARFAFLAAIFVIWLAFGFLKI